MKANRDRLAFTGLVVREGKGFYSLCPELDTASQGDTVAQAKKMLRDAVTAYLESCFESNLPYLRPTPSSNDPRNSEPDNIAATFLMRVDVAVKVHG